MPDTKLGQFSRGWILQSIAHTGGQMLPSEKPDCPGVRPDPWGTLGTHLITAFLEAELAEVRSQEGESIENLLRRFKRKVQTEDIIKDVKRHSFYLKPGEKKRVKRALAQKRARKKTRTYTDERR
jgi:small subunit ribosomal protein S21